MRRARRILVLVMVVCVVTAGMQLTGAFTSTSADRSVSVSVASDSSAFLALEPGDSPYAVQENGLLKLQFDGSGVRGNGLNIDAETSFSDVFTVRNQGTDRTRLQVGDDSAAIEFYATLDGTKYRLDKSNTAGAPLPVGSELNVSVQINSDNASAIESVDTITIEAVDSDQREDDDSGGLPGGSEDPPTTNIRDGQLQLTGTAESGESVEIGLSDIPNASSDRIEARSVRINYSEQTSLQTTVDLDSTGQSVSTPENASVLTYLNVSHPRTPNSAISDATFQFVVPHEEDRPKAVDLLRYNTTTETWESQQTKVSFVRNTSDGYVYEGHTESLSLFAVIQRVRGLLIQTEEASETIDASLLANPNSSFPTTAYETYQDQSFNASYWNERATRNADDAAAVIREKLKVSLKQAAKDTLIDKAVSYVDGVLKTTLGVSGIGTLLTAIDITLSSAEFVGSLGPAIQQKAVAIHVDPGTSEYDQLRTKLAALEQNSRALKTAVQNVNAVKQDALLREREQLLEDAYHLLPEYVDDVHADVIGNTAGLEDPRAYKQIRSQAESLRMLLLLDHQITTDRAYGAPDRSLARDTSMPTHGWTAFNRSEVYDTIDHTDDYVVLRLNGSRAVAANHSIDIDVRGTNASNFETELVSERPDDPRVVEGREIDGFGSRASEVVSPENEQFLVVRSDGAVGPLRVLVSAGNTSVPVSVAERAGPDIQRPHADLIQRPNPVTLQDGDVVYPTNTSETDLAWQLWDDKTRTEDIEYQFRVDGGDGFSEWSDWQFAPADGRVSPKDTYSDGITRVQLQVRDGSGRTAVRNADVVVSRGAPQTALAAPDDPTSNAVYVRVLPERQIERIDLQYRQSGSESFSTWKNITDTEDVGRLSVPEEGELVVRARAVGLDGDMSAWATERVTYEQRDTEPPEVDLSKAPAVRPTSTSDGVAQRRVTNAAETTLAWSAEDEQTATDELEYRLRTIDGSWSAWQATEDGSIETTVDVHREGTVTKLEVRDAAGNVATRKVTVYRDTDDPSVSVTARADVLGAVVNPSADEPLRSVQIQVRGENQSTWESVGSRPDTDQGTIAVDSAGSYELRARGIDSAGNVGPWSESVQFDSLPTDYGSSIIRNETTFTGGTVQEFDVGDAAVGAAQGYVLYNALVDEIDGELMLNLYMLSRDGNRIPISSIELTEERNQTVRADLPANLTSGAKLQVDVQGNGTVVLSSLRTIGAGPNVPPPAVTPERPNVDETVHLSVPDDWPGENYVSTFQWDVNGDGTFEDETSSASVNTSYRTGGTRNVTVAVTDIFGATRTANATVSVNAPPEPVIRAPDSVKTGESTEFNATRSVDSDGNITVYRWSIAGTDDRTGAAATVTFTDDGTYPVALVVEDDNGATSRATTNITVRNRPPEAVASTNKTNPLVGEQTRFSASESVDTDGSVAAFAWDVNEDGTYERSGMQIAEAFEQPGNKTLRLRVTDDDGATTTTTVQVHVNAPPESRLTVSTPVLTNESIDVDATGSGDPDGRLVAYQWRADGPATVTDDATTDTIRYPDDGVYPISVTVVDDDGATDTITRNVTVENRPPEAAAAVNETKPLVGEQVRFSAEDSSDVDGSVNEVAWDIDGDGIYERSGARIVEAFEQPGNKTIGVRVTDDDGTTNATNVTVRVNEPPVANITGPVSVATGETLSLSGAGSFDPDGQITDYAWSWANQEPTGRNVTTAFDDDGNYTVSLTVTDDAGETTTTADVVEVTNRPPSASLSRVDEEDPATVGQFVTWNTTVSDVDGTVDNATLRLTPPASNEPTRTVRPTDGETRAELNESGVWNVTLVAVDDDGARTVRQSTVEVNARPVAEVVISEQRVAGEPVTLTAYADDRDGTVESYEWIIGDRTLTGKEVNFTPDTAWEQVVRLIVTDDDGAERVVTRTIDVTAISADVSVEHYYGGHILSADANVDYEGDGEVGPIRYRWDVDGDGEYESSGGERVVSEPGTYEFTVRATLTETNQTVVASETVTVESLSEDVGVDWETRNGTGGEPKVDHGQVYVPAGEQEVGEGPEDESITALSRETGAQNWQASLPFNPYEVRTTDEAVYAIGSGIARINPDTGVVDWSVAPEGYPKITVTDTRVFLSTEESIRALDATTGQTSWNRTGVDANEQRVSDGRLVVSEYDYESGESTLVAHDTATGEVLWNRTGTGVWDVPTIAGGRVIATGADELRAYDADTGTLDWATTLQPNGSDRVYIDQTVVHNETIVVRGNDYPREYVIGLALDGSRKWSHRLDSEQELVPGAERVYAIGDGNATAIEPGIGAVQWHRQVPVDYPTLVGDDLQPIVVADNDLAFALEPETGETLWRGPTGGAIYRATYADGAIYVVTDDGTYAIEIQSKQLR